MTDTAAAPAATALDLDALEATARAAAAMAPGPWFWRGNTDYEEPSLSCIVPRLGRVEVLGHCPVDRERDSFEAREYIRGLEDCFGTLAEDVKERYLREWLWADEDYEVANTDSRLTVTDERNVKQPVRDLVVYEVARHRGLPDDTKRDHEGIHRGNIVDVRSPIAQHLAAASADTVLALIARIRGVEADLAHATTTARQEMKRADVNGEGSATAHRKLEDAADTVHRVTEVTEYLDELLQGIDTCGPTDEDYIRHEEMLRSVSFASGAVKAALNGTAIDNYLGSEQAEKDILHPARCYFSGSALPVAEANR
ncbi:hypothetical protein [Pseudarthrobacter chlorophenolicus]|nr:hypothetical protein [Pseudarthrobacter chlorophenolicus]